MQNRSSRGSGKPALARAPRARACDWDPIQRIALGPAAIRAASTGRTHGSTRPTCITLKSDLANREPFSNRDNVVNLMWLAFLLPRGHGSLRGRNPPPQPQVRSTGPAMSTTGSLGVRTAQRLPSQSPAPSPRRGNRLTSRTPARPGPSRLPIKPSPAAPTHNTAHLNAICCGG